MERLVVRMAAAMKGVVHVGAHLGEEVPRYVAEGRDPIICFEPLSFGPLFEHPINWISFGLHDVTGHFILRVPKHLHDDSLDTQSSSMFKLINERARAIGWTPSQFENEVMIFCVRFDEWARRVGFKRDCSLLVIDVQGAELNVLRGFGDYLQDFSELKIECSQPAVYHGGADAKEVVHFLDEQGFEAITPILTHGDIEFRKRVQ